MLKLDRPEHDRPAACVIAQQYSSAIFASLRFNSRKENLGALVQILHYFYLVFTIFKIAYG